MKLPISVHPDSDSIVIDAEGKVIAAFNDPEYTSEFVNLINAKPRIASALQMALRNFPSGPSSAKWELESVLSIVGEVK